jgi:hypothetical protein
VYYHNTITGESSWSKPEGFVGDDDGAARRRWRAAGATRTMHARVLARSLVPTACGRPHRQWRAQPPPPPPPAFSHAHAHVTRGSTAGAAGAPVPVAQAQVGDTPWYEVKCTDGRRYYFNHDSQETAWSMPPEVRLARRACACAWCMCMVHAHGA